MEGVTVFDTDPMDGGVSVRGWLKLWDRCHTTGYAGPQFTAWPDGRSLMEQPQVVVSMFDLIGDAVQTYSESRRALASAGTR